MKKIISFVLATILLLGLCACGSGGVTEQGRRQIELLAERLRGLSFDAVYSSDLYRACLTASAVYRPLGLPLRTDPSLREINVGPWERTFFGNLLHDQAESARTFLLDPARWQLPGAETLSQVAQRALPALEAIARRLSLPVPRILMEPGRSIVADAGMTLYTVGSVKEITGYKRYVSIDGGMSDNPRFALYGSKYTCFNAGRMDDPADMRCDLVGKCCESGDIIQPDILMPSATKRGDTVAVCTTGAYNFSMASGYNRLPRPPVVMLKDGRSYVAVKGETLDDIVRLDN